MVIEAKAMVTYIRTLTGEETQRVLDYMEEHGITESDTLSELWSEGEIEIYDDDTVESDCNTEEINFLRMEDND